MVIFKKIYQDYRASMKSKQSDNSSDNVEFVTLNFIVGKIREQERNNRESPRRAYVDKVVKPILIAHAKQQSEMIDDLLKINSKDKKILKSVNEMKEAINICLRYLTDQELKSVEIKHMGKNIKTVGNEEGPTEDSVGTAFFVDDKGHLVTNYHVVKSSNNKAKILFNHEEVDTNMIAYDELLDLALLKAKVKNKDFIKFSNKSPQKAQSVLVAGFPYGKFVSDDLKITSGIINSLKGIKNNTSMLQIDATINPGNSGGPIVDKLSGNLVGVATMKLSKDFTKQAFGQESENTNYGIKSSQVRDFLEANNIEIKVKSGKLKIDNLESSTVFIFSKKV